MVHVHIDDALLGSPDALDALDVGLKLLAGPKPRLFFRAPARVRLDKQHGVPAALWQVDSLVGLQQHPLLERAIAVAVDLRDGVVRVGSLRPEDYEAPEPFPQEAGARPPPVGAAVNSRYFDLVEVCHVPRRVGDYLVSVVLLDQHSNREPVSVRASDLSDAFHDPAVDALINAEYLRKGHPRVWPLPTAHTPSYAPRPDVPTPPDAAGIVMTAPRAVAQRPGTPWPLRGAWRLPLRPEDIVRTPDATVEHMERRGFGRPTAVVPVSLLFTGADSPRDVLVQLGLPTFDPIDVANPPGSVTGCFSLDLQQTFEGKLEPQTYFVYAFSREVMAGPVQTALVAAERLPER